MCLKIGVGNMHKILSHRALCCHIISTPCCDCSMNLRGTLQYISHINISCHLTSVKSVEKRKQRCLQKRNFEVLSHMLVLKPCPMWPNIPGKWKDNYNGRNGLTKTHMVDKLKLSLILLFHILIKMVRLCRHCKTELTVVTTAHWLLTPVS